MQKFKSVKDSVYCEWQKRKLIDVPPSKVGNGCNSFLELLLPEY